MGEIKLIALDMDGTLLTTDKKLTERNRAALFRAHQAGIWIVPTTGRIFPGLPREVLELPFLRYAITANGASVYDAAQERVICRAEIPVERSVEVMEWLDGCPVIYDCYMDDKGWMTKAMRDQAAVYAPNPHYLEMINRLRQPVPELKAFLQERGQSVQKIQAFCLDVETQKKLLEEAAKRFPDLVVSSSVSRNVEINHGDAHKGHGLLALAAYLGLEPSQTMAFGDGLNDLTMIRDAGVGVAMGNAIDQVKALAQRVTADNDSDGVALVIEELLE